MFKVYRPVLALPLVMLTLGVLSCDASRGRVDTIPVAAATSAGVTTLPVNQSGQAAEKTRLFRVQRHAPAVRHSALFFGVRERFNRYYTDEQYAPTRTIYVNEGGGGDGRSESAPDAVENALRRVQPGDLIQFAAGQYEGCWMLDAARSGTYELPIVLRGSVDVKGRPATIVNCCNVGHQACVNLEHSSYVAIDQFEFAGGKFGVRAAAGYDTSKHAVGNAVLHSYSHDNSMDSILTGGNDWFVIEGTWVDRAGSGDGHGIYLSNGGDFNVVRYNDVFDNYASDFQVNADPNATCKEHSIEFTDPKCDGDSKLGVGNGASDYFLIENNYFHGGRAQGPNFTSVRRSIIRNNIFAFYRRHGVSFWQETPNPNLGSRYNTICHNLFIGTNYRELVQFTRHSDFNEFRNNVLLGVTWSSHGWVANPNVPLLVVSETITNNVFDGNMYIGGVVLRVNETLELADRKLGPTEAQLGEAQTSWFRAFPTERPGSADDFRPQPGTPWLLAGKRMSACPFDFDGSFRAGPVTLGPWNGG